jgi:hypothetical protein
MTLPTPASFSAAEEAARKLSVKVGDVVCAWLRVRGSSTAKVFAKVVMVHGNGSLRVDFKDGHHTTRVECKSWRMLSAEERERYNMLCVAGKTI